MSSHRRTELRFKMTAYTPETLPMARLAEYLTELAVLLGERSAVHFMKLEKGSVVPVIAVDREETPKVIKRVNAVKRGEGPADARQAMEKIDRWLADDNASGELLGPTGARILKFVGRNRLVEPEYGPFTQADTLDGVVIVLGGESDPVPVHIQDGDTVHICRATRAVAKQLAPHLFGAPVRVSGSGRWFRDASGRWEMRHFLVSTFAPLREEELGEAVSRLRDIPAEWKRTDDPLGSLTALRKGDIKH